MTQSLSHQAVLFDLDGTLADTAPDLTYALNQVRIEESYPVLSDEYIRPSVSHGSIAMIQRGFDIGPEHADFERLRIRLLEIYRDNICHHTTLFPGMDAVLDHLEQQQILWGIVTNKPARFTDPLVEQLKLQHRAASVVSGDTLNESKPHPAPLWHACKKMRVEAKRCIYVGDAARDIEAGKRAGMMTLAAIYGYIGESDYPEQWQADQLIEHPHELLNYLVTANNNNTDNK